MPGSSWRYIAQRIDGEGPGVYLDWDVPLFDVQHTDVLSGPCQLNASIPVEIGRLKAEDGRPLLDEWGTIILAEVDGRLEDGGAFIVVNSEFAGPDWSLSCLGFSTYPKGMPYTESWYGVGVDPLDVYRRIWSHLQAQPGGNLGVVLDGTTSPVRIGTQLENVQFQTQAGQMVAFEAGPKKLAWYVTDDLGNEQDSLAKDTPFDYHEKTTWLDKDAGTFEMRIELEYPRRGRRLDNRFAVGENIHQTPTVSRTGDDYANGVMVLGAGEGRDMVHTLVQGPRRGRLRRVATVSDKECNTLAKATARANRELASRLLIEDVTQVVISDHPHAPRGSYRVGDEILIVIEDDWVSATLWFRILAIGSTPDGSSDATVTIKRSDKAAA